MENLPLHKSLLVSLSPEELASIVIKLQNERNKLREDIRFIDRVLCNMWDGQSHWNDTIINTMVLSDETKQKLLVVKHNMESLQKFISSLK